MNARWFVLGFMSTALSVAFAAAAERQGRPMWAKAAGAQHRTLSAIQVDVRDALLAEAVSRRLGPNVADVMRLVHLYREIAVHPKRHNSPSLKQLGSRVRSRLKSVRERIERQAAQEERRAENNDRLPTLRRPRTHVLAQQAGVAGGVGQGGQSAAIPPGTIAGIDYGPDLVDLIQQTISPETWDINGGLGAIVYYEPLRVIVVSAPATVHDQVGDVLGQLRAAP